MDYKKIVFEIADKIGFKFNEETEKVEIVSIPLKGDVIVYSVSELELGSQLYTDEKMTILLDNGEYETVDGITFEIIDTVVGVINTNEDEENIEQEETKVDDTKVDDTKEEEKVMSNESELVDGTIIYYEEDIVSGVTLFIDEEMTTPVEDGEYTTVDGEIIIITNGVVENIKSIIDENSELKSVIADIEVELKQIEDLKAQIVELEKSNQLFKTNEIELKKAIEDKPAVDSLLFEKKDDIKEKTDKKYNRELTKHIFNNIKR